ncbi:AMP dependent ligase/synthetase [Entamoeba marina]
MSVTSVNARGTISKISHVATSDSDGLKSSSANSPPIDPTKMDTTSDLSSLSSTDDSLSPVSDEKARETIVITKHPPQTSQQHSSSSHSENITTKQVDHKKKRFSLIRRKDDLKPKTSSRSLNIDAYKPEAKIHETFTSLTQEHLERINSCEYDPECVITSFYSQAKARGNAIAFIDDGEEITWKNFISRTNKFTKVFANATNPIIICMRNCYESYAISFAANLVRVPVIFVNPTTSLHVMKGIISESDANVLVYDWTCEQLVSKLVDSFPYIYYTYPESSKKYHNPQGSSFKELLENGLTGTKVESKNVQAIKDSILPKDVLEYVFIPGEDTFYKGVIWTNGAVYTAVNNLLSICDIRAGSFIVSYLPQSYYLERIISLYIHLKLGLRIVIAQPSTMNFDCKELFKVLKAYEPSFFLGIPRVYEKIARALDVSLSKGSMSKFARKLSSRSKSDTISVSSEDEEKESTPRAMSKKYVVKKSKELTGLGSCGLLLCSGRISDTVNDVLISSNIFVYEGLSFAETTGFCVLNSHQSKLSGTVGKPINVDLTIKNGELCVTGPTISPGYTCTKSEGRFDDYGFHTLWKASFVKNAQSKRFVQISFQLDHFIVTSGAEVLYPSAMEDVFRKIPTVKDCLIVGDGQKNISIFILVDDVMVKKLLKDKYSSSNELSKNQLYCTYLTRRIQVANTYFPRPHQVKRFALFTTFTQLEKGKHSTVNGRLSVYKKYENHIKALGLLKPTN